MNIFYHFRLPVEAVLSNGAKNCFSFSNEFASQVKSRPELFWLELELYQALALVDLYMIDEDGMQHWNLVKTCGLLSEKVNDDVKLKCRSGARKNFWWYCIWYLNVPSNLSNLKHHYYSKLILNLTKKTEVFSKRFIDALAPEFQTRWCFNRLVVESKNYDVGGQRQQARLRGLKVGALARTKWAVWEDKRTGC